MLLAMPGTLAPLFDPAPLRALLVSGVGTLVVGLLTLFIRNRSHAVIPVAGLLIAASATAALIRIRPSAIIAALGVGVLALSGALTDFGLRSFSLRAAVAIPGAWLIAFRATPSGADWLPWLVFATITLGGALIGDFGRGSVRATWGAPLFAITAVGVFLTVPDTEEAAVLVAAAAPVALLGWPIGLAGLGGAGSFATIGIATWVIAWGGIGREASVVGAVACLGLLIAEPLARRLTRQGTLIDRLPEGTAALLVVGALHFVLVMFASRVAGLRDDVLEASLLALAALGVALLALTVIQPEAVVTHEKDALGAPGDPRPESTP